ncbi:hypothetical protein HO133_009041 [Letharia lupina]|uniref:Uncharacterized protein n=1 Tax=Letharia lupina TaxID=560253 RepID=A0A8H6FF94_9LECA|nr:uncharacterized protein HO133_009041 [Letharia lupina]KAF6226175.1 hypothetical protein HO133_009041 [Letharia lupina]
MCYYNIFYFECGCESQSPAFQFPCRPARAGQRSVYHDFDHHHGPPQACPLFIVHRERITPGKCASHSLQAQLEKRIKALKDEIKRLKDDIAEHQDLIDQEKKVRRARNHGRPGYGGPGGHGEHDKCGGGRA